MKTNTSQSDVRTNGVFYSTTILHQVVYVAYNSLLTNQTYLQKPLGFLIIPWPRVEVQCKVPGARSRRRRAVTATGHKRRAPIRLRRDLPGTKSAWKTPTPSNSWTDRWSDPVFPLDGHTSIPSV